MTTLAAALVLAAAAGAAEDRIDPVPAPLRDVGVDERLEALLPLDRPFVDASGRKVTLRDYVRPDRPLLLTLNYYRCPMLCTLELDGLVAGLHDLDWSIGREFDVLTVSIDPKESPALARAKRQSYLAEYGRPSGADGWHFLTGPADSIRALADTLGFTYRYDPVTDQYAHAAVVFLITPEGRVSRYLYGVRFEAKTLKLALTEASQGKAGSSWERFLLSCYAYDSNQGRYVIAARRLMRAGGLLTVLVLGAALSSFWIRERRRSRPR